MMLRQQLRAIQDELGERPRPSRPKSPSCASAWTQAELPETVRKEAERELARLERMSADAPDYQITRTYIELVLELPWNKRTEDNLDLARARAGARRGPLRPQGGQGADHRAPGGAEAEPAGKAPILCFVGPPGVGKTSLGQSIARALGSKFERMSLGGMHDEAELRGHRRTYIGAMPGRIHPGHSPRGREQPAADARRGRQARARLPRRPGRRAAGDPRPGAELRVPRQLPRPAVRPVRACSSSPRPTRSTRSRAPLLDRMEILRLSGYSEEEKLQIARRYILGRTWRTPASRHEQFTIRRHGAGRRHPPLHARGRRARARARTGRASRARSPRASPRATASRSR